MNTAMPLAVADSSTEPSSDSAAIDHDSRDQPQTGRDGVVGPPPAGGGGDQQRRRVHGRHVGAAHAGRGGEAPREQRAAPERAHHERLQEAALGVAAHGAQGEEHRKHAAQEQRGEHRQPEQRRSGQDLVVHRRLAADLADRVEGGLGADGIERQEAECEDEHDHEHAPASRLAQGVEGDRPGAAHVAPSTASR